MGPRKLLQTSTESREGTLESEDLHHKVRTVTRTLRIPAELESDLEKHSRENGISFNALVTRILTKHSEWEQFALGLGVAPISKKMLVSALEASDDQSLVLSVRRTLPAAWKDMMRYLFGNHSVDSFLKLISLASRYGLLGAMEVKKDGKLVTILIPHDMGYKFSLLLENGLDELFRSTYQVKPVFESSPCLVMMKFPMALP